MEEAHAGVVAEGERVAVEAAAAHAAAVHPQLCHFY
jgi:hypothetical protein